MVGTPKNSVGLKSRNSAAAFWCSKRSSKRMRQPESSQQCRPLPSACTWNSGRASRKRSAAVMRQESDQVDAVDGEIVVREDRALGDAGGAGGVNQRGGRIGGRGPRRQVRKVAARLPRAARARSASVM